MAADWFSSLYPKDQAGVTAMAGEPSKFLNSWKEIAAYLHCGVRTVQRWESALGLPVVRPHGRAHSPVLAACADIDDWVRLRSRKVQTQISVGATARMTPQLPLKLLNSGIDLGVTFATMAISSHLRGTDTAQRLRSRATQIHRLVLGILDRIGWNHQDAVKVGLRLKELELALEKFGDWVSEKRVGEHAMKEIPETESIIRWAPNLEGFSKRLEGSF